MGATTSEAKHGSGLKPVAAEPGQWEHPQVRIHITLAKPYSTLLPSSKLFYVGQVRLGVFLVRPGFSLFLSTEGQQSSLEIIIHKLLVLGCLGFPLIWCGHPLAQQNMIALGLPDLGNKGRLFYRTNFLERGLLFIYILWSHSAVVRGYSWPGSKPDFISPSAPYLACCQSRTEGV